MTDSIPVAGVCDCLGRTCLKWGADGELTALDLSLVMQRLAQVDPEVSALQEITPTAQACPSAS
ncbi:MAG: hypothetical protein VKK62_02095 [Synechococcaceae cyanobacterium]|nr:hypothetical protein [Synechococcaceae cyanobacterium]